MTKLLRIFLCSVFICLMILPISSFAEVGKDEGDGIIGNTSYAYSELGFVMGEASNHGNNQTRIAYTSSGIYVSCPTDEFESKYNPYAGQDMSGENCALYVIRPDGTVKVLMTDSLFWIAAGTTTNVMVDKNEDIWVCSSWEEGSGFYPLIAWHYDVSEDKVTKYDEVGYYKKGSGYGKPVSIMDAENGVIYQISLGGQKCPGRMIWTTFDIETKTWTKTMKCFSPPCSCCYHFGYATGKGGFVFVTSRTLDNLSTFCNIEGMRVNEAMNLFQNRASIDVGQVWDETHLIYVPDATKEKVYDLSFGDAVYDVENGIYPLVINRSSDIYYDESTGYLYALRLEQDCEAIGLKMMLYIFDTKKFEEEVTSDQFFDLLCKKEIVFSYGSGTNYFPRMVEDLEGNLYIVVATERSGEIEIWRATDELGSNYEFVYTCGVDSYYDDFEYSQWRSLIVANNRNNSKASDTIYFLYECGHKWETFSINFAALREKFGLTK